MIAYITGKLAFKSPDTVVVETGGFGCEIFVPLSTFSGLPEVGVVVTLLTCFFIRDDTIRVYGFLTTEEKEIFKLLLDVTGIGPKLARSILSGSSVGSIVRAISGEDLSALTALPGVGKKTAGRILVELKDKVADIQAARGGELEAGAGSAVRGHVADVISALRNLGYKGVQAEQAAKKASEELVETEAGFEVLFKRALSILSS